MEKNNFWEISYQKNYSGSDTDICSPLVDYISNFNKNDIVLDYGCGSGRVMGHINKMYPGITGHIYDVSSTAIDNSFQNIPHNNLIRRTHTYFKPIFIYTKIITHRVIHNMSDNSVFDFFETLSQCVNNNTEIFISVKSKNCLKYIDKLNNIKFTKKDGGFYNPNTNRYVKFYSIEDIYLLLNKYKINVKKYGEFEEKSFRKSKINKYIYIHGTYNTTQDSM